MQHTRDGVVGCSNIMFNTLILIYMLAIHNVSVNDNPHPPLPPTRATVGLGIGKYVGKHLMPTLWGKLFSPISTHPYPRGGSISPVCPSAVNRGECPTPWGGTRLLFPY